MGVYAGLQKKDDDRQKKVDHIAKLYEDKIANDLGKSIGSFISIIRNVPEYIAPVLNIAKELQDKQEEDYLQQVSSSKYGM